ncbi:unnamed protein product [Paramecium octaurelia]|uniref:Uncharacterized protein n=1 Tax=Paramecium octaurelia TaxID=43137 RepID=A0A8S1UXQ9_PAROT|nr:unnamed protein product [Paramecium octaurelia]
MLKLLKIHPSSNLTYCTQMYDKQYINIYLITIKILCHPKPSQSLRIFSKFYNQISLNYYHSSWYLRGAYSIAYSIIAKFQLPENQNHKFMQNLSIRIKFLNKTQQRK